MGSSGDLNNHQSLLQTSALEILPSEVVLPVGGGFYGLYKFINIPTSPYYYYKFNIGKILEDREVF